MAKNSTIQFNNQVLGEVKTKEGPLVVIKKQHLTELVSAFRAIVRGEEALRGSKTRKFNDFLKKMSSRNDKNK
ncbi:MAG: hypothetical protein HYT12_00390 [Candidatus Liptonbacteria bacterium]|nr:hypothetical protein [Candidatus Liptonbacteria bacterium]